MPLIELKNQILQKYKSESEMARSMKWPRQKLNKITNGVKVPDVGEISELSQALNISISRVASFFLNH